MKIPARGCLFLVGLLVLAAGLSACTAGGETGAYSGTLVLEGSHHYSPGAVLPGLFLVLDGEAALAAGARVDGPVFLMGGRLVIDGTVNGEVSVIGGSLEVGPQAEITGDLRVGNGKLELSPSARLHGQTLTGAASGLEPEQLFPSSSVETRLAWLLPQALLFGAAAALAQRFLPAPARRVRRAAVGHPLVSGAMGLLAGLVGLILLVVLAFTLILIPVTLLGFILGVLAVGWGWIGIGLEAGAWLRARWKPSWSPLQAAFAGAFLFSVVLNLCTLLPLAGSYLGLCAAALSLGAVTLTRFGLRDFTPPDAGLMIFDNQNR